MVREARGTLPGNARNDKLRNDKSYQRASCQRHQTLQLFCWVAGHQRMWKRRPTPGARGCWTWPKPGWLDGWLLEFPRQREQTNQRQHTPNNTHLEDAALRRDAGRLPVADDAGPRRDAAASASS